ncbi:MAG: hypothetical protein ACE5IM_08735 [Nitrospinota bacterium]
MTARPAPAPRKPRPELRLFLICWIVYALFVSPFPQSMALNMLDLATSIVDKQSLALDQYHGMDTARRGETYLSGLPPGGSFLAVPYFFLLRPLIRLFPKGHELLVLNTLLALLAGGPATALTAVLLFRFLRNFPCDERQRLLASVAFAFGTMAFGYAEGFYKKTFASLALFLAFSLLYANRGGGGDARGTPRRTFLAGLLCGSAFLLDYPTPLFSLVLFLYLLATPARRSAPWFVLGAIPPLLLLGGYQYAAFGNPFYTSHAYAELTVAQKFRPFSLPVLLDSWVGPFHGLFVYSPVLALSVAGLFIGWKRDPGLRKELGAIAAFFLVNSILVASLTYPWTGEVSLAARQYLPSIPFLTIPLIYALAESTRRLFKILLAVSVFFSYLAAQAGHIPTLPWPLVYTLKDFASSFGTGAFFSELLPRLLDLPTLHLFLASPEHRLEGLLGGADSQWLPRLVAGQGIVLGINLAFFAAAAIPILRLARPLLGVRRAGAART